MSHVKPLAMATAVVLGLTGMQAFAAPPATRTSGPAPSVQPLYYMVNPGTAKAQKVYYFDRLDGNRDGQLSRSELPSDMHLLRAYFMEADWDQNGKLSPDEYVMYKTHTGPEYVGVEHALLFVND